MRVGVACDVQPMPAHLFAISRRLEIPIDHLLEGVHRAISEDLVEFLDGRRKSREAERHATNECGAITIAVEDTLPEGFAIVDGALTMTEANTINGKVVHQTYLVNSNLEPGIYMINGEVNQPMAGNLAPSEIEVISAETNLEDELGKRIRQGILVVPTTAVFDMGNSENSFDMLCKVGRNGTCFI